MIRYRNVPREGADDDSGQKTLFHAVKEKLTAKARVKPAPIKRKTSKDRYLETERRFRNKAESGA